MTKVLVERILRKISHPIRGRGISANVIWGGKDEKREEKRGEI
jgi:hypothetical protein